MDRVIISCGVYLFRKDNKFLVEHPTKHKPNVWTIPKGRMDVGESDYFKVAKRELYEETNINLNNYRILEKYEFDILHVKGNKYFKSFFIKVDSDFSDVEIKCDSMVYRNGFPVFPEVDNFRWVTINDGYYTIVNSQISNLDKCKELLYKFR